MEWRQKRRQGNTSFEFNTGGLWPFLEFEIEPNKRLAQDLLGDENPADLFCPHIKDIQVEGGKAYVTASLALVMYHEHGSVGLCLECLEQALQIVKDKLTKKEEVK